MVKKKARHKRRDKKQYRGVFENVVSAERTIRSFMVCFGRNSSSAVDTVIKRKNKSLHISKITIDSGGKKVRNIAADLPRKGTEGMEKWPPEVLYRKSCSSKLRNIYSKTPVWNLFLLIMLQA